MMIRSTSIWLHLVVLLVAAFGCTKPNPNVCCETAADFDIGADEVCP